MPGADGYGWVVCSAPSGTAWSCSSLYGGLIWLTKKQFEAVPEGFVPVQDKQYLDRLRPAAECRLAGALRCGAQAHVGDLPGPPRA